MKSTHRMTVSLALVALIATSAIPSATATRPRKARTITLSGSKSGWTDVHFDSKVNFLAGQTDVKTSGDYAAYVLQKKGESAYRSGAFWFSIFEAADDESLTPQSISYAKIPAGDYRLYLLTDGRSTLRIPVEGLKAAMKVTPRSSVSVDAGVRDLPTSPSIEDRIPVKLKEKSVLFGGHFFASDQHQVTTVEQCLKEAGGNHCLSDTKGVAAFNGAILSPGNVVPGWAMSWFLLAHPRFADMAPPGNYEIFQRFAASVATFRQHNTFWLQFELV